MYLSQIMHLGQPRVVVRNAGHAARLLSTTSSVYELALLAANEGKTLDALVQREGLGEEVDLEKAYSEGRVLCPINHPNPANLLITGTGLTHLGSASARNAMHGQGENVAAVETDSLKMFKLGLEGGKPASGEIGVQPEWFYKGTGTLAVPPGGPLVSPAFALDGGEEPEIAGIYIVDDAGTPWRLGFALANEFSDHVTEKMNYLYLAHSKLRPMSFGPEIWVGPLPPSVHGMSKIIRDGKTIWEKEFTSGEDNMSHSIANLEYHHFKYRQFRRPGDVHVHMFGTSVLSFNDGVAARDGDVFVVESASFGLPLRNEMQVEKVNHPKVNSLYEEREGHAGPKYPPGHCG